MTAESQYPKPDPKKDRVVLVMSASLVTLEAPYDLNPVKVREDGDSEKPITHARFVPRLEDLPDGQAPRFRDIPFMPDITVGTPEQLLQDFQRKFESAVETLFNSPVTAEAVVKTQERLKKLWPQLSLDKAEPVWMTPEWDEQYRALRLLQKCHAIMQPENEPS